MGFVLFLLFLRKLILVKMYLDFYYSRWKTSKPGQKEQTFPIKISTERAEKIQMEFNISYFSSRRLELPVRRILVGLPLGLQRGLSQSPSQEHRGSPVPMASGSSLGMKTKLDQDISLQERVGISEVNQGQKLYRDGREKGAECVTAGTALV